MKIVLEKSKKFYAESFYISYFLNIITNNPKKKTESIINHFFKPLLLFLILFLFALYAFFKTYYSKAHDIFVKNMKVYIIIMVILFVLFLGYLLIIIFMAININNLYKKSDNILYYDKNKLSLYNGSILVSEISWDNVKYIIFNKYSITVIPYKEVSKYIMSFDAKNKQAIENIIKKYNKNDLIINNY